MSLGTVKKLMIDKYCGFISPVAGGGDIFFHGSTLAGNEFAALAPGQRVEFEIDADSLTDERGARAGRVRILHAGQPAAGEKQGEFRQLRRHPASRAKKPTWRNRGV
jgi:CspA family cold shock protein